MWNNTQIWELEKRAEIFFYRFESMNVNYRLMGQHKCYFQISKWKCGYFKKWISNERKFKRISGIGISTDNILLIWRFVNLDLCHWISAFAVPLNATIVVYLPISEAGVRWVFSNTNTGEQQAQVAMHLLKRFSSQHFCVSVYLTT